jgi:atypical dual specificity phosphatase
LPAAALAAIAEFAKPAEQATEPVHTAVKAVATSLASASPKATSPAAALPAIAPAVAVKTTLAVLPPISARGVKDAAMVGRDILPNYCGPTGFNWIVPGRLAGCAEPGVFSAIDYDMGLLRNMGITHLITLTDKDLDQNALARNKLSNLHLPIHDREAPSMAQTYMLVRRMQVLLDQGSVLAVHCRAGIGRTGTILAAWLIREGGLSATHGIERLRTICRTYVQTQAQEQFLQNFEQDIMRRM